MTLRCSDFEKRAHEAREKNHIEDYPDVADFRQNPFLRYLDSRSDAYLVNRKRTVKAITTQEEALAYQIHIREAFKRCLGPLPECPPGRVEVMNSRSHGDYAVDSVRIESVPGVFITANFYYPTSSASPRPAVLFPCGHSPEGKASPMYVSFGVEAAKNGLCVLIYDPIGQGERRLRSGQPEEGWMSPVDAHCFIDRQMSTVGEHLAPFMVAESVRALDYLLSRPEVDSNRVAVSGNSGGGMMSAYMGAYDDRIHVVAPSCYITELRALLQRILAQDAEQCTPGFMESGLDLSDLITAAAPKPYMVGGALYDFFPIDGLRNALVEAKRMYRLLGAEETVQAYIAQKGHGMWVDTRMEVLKFLCRHFEVPFQGNDAVDYDSLPSEADLVCGEISEAAGDIGAYLSSKVKDSSISGDVTSQLKQILKLKESPRPRFLESTDSHVWIESEPGMKIECLLVVPEQKEALTLHVVVGALEDAELSPYTSDAWLYVQPRGIGSGAMQPNSCFGIFDVESSSYYYARLLGETLQGMRVTDVLAAIKLMKEKPEYSSARIVLHGREEHALTALYAASIGDADEVQLDRLLNTFRDVSMHTTHAWGTASFVIGLGRDLDVCDLIADLADRVTVRQYVDLHKQEV